MKKRKKRITVPVIMQMEALECGAASLAMILAYHGKWLPLEQVRSDCGVSRDGSKASSIAKAGRRKEKRFVCKKITNLHLFCSTFALFLLLNDTFPDFSNRKTNIRNPKDI